MRHTITPAELHELYRAGEALELMDVRTPAEFANSRVEFARNVPLDQLTPNLIRHMRGSGSDRPLYVICQKGGRGQQACEILTAAGFPNVFNVEGGTAACHAAALPMIGGCQSISLERQVRIAAGSLVLVGSLLGLFMHRYWTALPAFVGAGLVFAGVTDSCGLAMILARMPWNQRREEQRSCREPRP
jgi:rhodanese-related sulfurtransferase